MFLYQPSDRIHLLHTLATTVFLNQVAASLCLSQPACLKCLSVYCLVLCFFFPYPTYGSFIYFVYDKCIP